VPGKGMNQTGPAANCRPGFLRWLWGGLHFQIGVPGELANGLNCGRPVNPVSSPGLRLHFGGHLRCGGWSTAGAGARLGGMEL